MLLSTLVDHLIGEPEPRDQTTTHHRHLPKTTSHNHLLKVIVINKVKVSPEQVRGRQNQDPEHDRSLRTLDLVSSATLR